MSSLAIALRYQKKYDEAEQVYRQTLELREKILWEHPSSLDSMNLITYFINKGNTMRQNDAPAVELRGYELREILGQEHPSTRGHIAE